MNRSLKALEEQEIFDILREQDRKRGTPPELSDTEFLLELYNIAPLGKVFCTSDQAAAIMNLRVMREGIEKTKPYTDYSVRQKVFSGSEKDFEREYSNPEGTSTLYPLDEEEQKKLIGLAIHNMLFFLVKDVLKVKLMKGGTKKVKPASTGKKGRPRIHPEKPKNPNVGRPITTPEGRIRSISNKLKNHYLKKDREGMEQALQELTELVHAVE